MKIYTYNIKDVFKSKVSNIETLELKGYELIKEYFVDNSGFGTEDEIASTPSRFIKELEKDLLNNGGSGYTFITNVGQFQVYVGLFKKKYTNKTKKIANNTIAIYNDNKELQAIRLHDTNIIEITSEGLKLNNGGYETRTTKERLNRYLTRYQIYQKNYTWYVWDKLKQEPDKEYVNDMIINDIATGINN